MSIADRIAADHVFRAKGRTYFVCSCGEWDSDDPRAGTYGWHLVQLTEAAVRAQVAADIEVKRAEAALAATAYRETGDESAAWEAAMSAHAYGYAARIAEEGPQP